MGNKFDEVAMCFLWEGKVLMDFYGRPFVVRRVLELCVTCRARIRLTSSRTRPVSICVHGFLSSGTSVDGKFFVEFF